MKILNGADLQMYIVGTTEDGKKATQWNYMDICVDLYAHLESYKFIHPNVVHIEIHMALPTIGYTAEQRSNRPITIEVTNDT